MPFCKEVDIKLIKLVRDNPVIYSSKSEKHLESDSRDLAWRRISEAINKPAVLCKTRWINIRDNMRRKIRERERRPSLKLKKHHPNYKYRYEDELDFILPYFKGNKVDLDGDEAEEDHDMSSRDLPEQEHVYIDTEYDEQEREIKPDISSILPVNVERDQDCFASSSHANVNYSVSTSERDTDAISVFLEAVGSTLRNLNPYYLNQAKSKIFQVVQDAELQQIVNKGEQPTANP